MTLKCSRQQGCLALAMTICVFMFHGAAAAQTAELEPGADSDVKIADWSWLDFNGQKDYQLTKVIIKFRDGPYKVGEEFKDQKLTVKLTIEDKSQLEVFQNALQTAMIAVPRRGDGGFGIAPKAMMECHITRGIFRIYWNHVFIYNQEGHAYHVAFRSMGLAALLDRVLREAEHKGISEEEMDDLSGANLLRIDRKKFGINAAKPKQ